MTRNARHCGLMIGLCSSQHVGTQKARIKSCKCSFSACFTSLHTSLDSRAARACLETSLLISLISLISLTYSNLSPCLAQHWVSSWACYMDRCNPWSESGLNLSSRCYLFLSDSITAFMELAPRSPHRLGTLVAPTLDNHMLYIISFKILIRNCCGCLKSKYQLQAEHDS